MIGRDTIAAFLEWEQSIGAWGALLFGIACISAAVLLMPASMLTIGAGFVFGVATSAELTTFGMRRHVDNPVRTGLSADARGEKT